MLPRWGMVIAVLLVSATLNAFSITGVVPDTAAEGEYYAPGIINPAEGTIELTALPNRPGSEFQNEWFFAFSMTPGQPIKANNLLGLYTPASEGGIVGFAAIARSGDNSYSVVNKSKEFLKPGVPVNLALSWGKAGLIIYVDGKLYAKGSFSKNDVLRPMPALFKIGVNTPFNIQAAKISARQLPPANLTADPAKGFAPAVDTSFLWSKGKGAQYLITDYSRKVSPVLMPLWQLAGAMSPAGEDAAIVLTGLNLSSAPAAYKVSITATTFEGATVGTVIQEVVIAPAAKFAEQKVALPVKSIGFYNLNIAITGTDGTSSTWKSTYMIYPANDVKVKDGKFAEYMGHDTLEQAEILAKIGIRWGRAWNDGTNYFLWFNVEPQPGVFDWSRTDKALDKAEKNGVKVLGVLGYPPLWAAENPNYEKVPHPQAHMSGRWKPRSVEEWSNYVYQTVSRYKNRVKYWEIYNEVDFHPPGLPATFSGSTQDYFELLKGAWTAAKKADPECKILISGFSTISACDVNMPYDLLKMGAAKYIDIFSLHSYQGVLGVDKLRQAVNAVAPGMPFWQTEQSWFQISDPGKQCELTSAIQFWFVEKKFDKYFNFSTATFTNIHTRSPDALLQILAVVQNNLRKSDEFAGILPDAAVRDFDIKHSFKRTDGNYFTAIGKVDAKTVLRLSGDIITAQDMFGRELKITRDGVTSVLPSTAIAYLVSTTPLRVIEAKSQIKSPCLNPGFEDISGDTTGGLKSVSATNWVLRAKNYDKGGEIILDERARTGKYALRISASGQGRVYVFFETLGLAPGKYNFSVWLKSANDKTATAYCSMFIPLAKELKTVKFANISPGQYTKYTAEYEIKKRPEGNVMFIIGTGMDKEQCSILCDDVELKKQPLLRPESTQNINTDNPGGLLNPKSGKREINLQNMIFRIGGTQNIDGVNVEVSRKPVILSGSSEWSGITGKTYRISLTGYFTRIAFLVGAMYVPGKDNLLGSFNIVFRDGSSEVFNLENNKNIRDWWMGDTNGKISPDLVFVNEALSEYGLFLPVWNNPSLGKEITAVEVKAGFDGLLCLAAVVAEKK